MGQRICDPNSIPSVSSINRILRNAGHPTDQDTGGGNNSGTGESRAKSGDNRQMPSKRSATATSSSNMGESSQSFHQHRPHEGAYGMKCSFKHTLISVRVFVDSCQ